MSDEPEGIAAELASEHHERINTVSDAADAAQEKADAAERTLGELREGLYAKADAVHEHPEYVTRGEIDGIRADMEAMIHATERAAEAAEGAAADAAGGTAAAAKEPAESGEGAAAAASELPLPAPEQQTAERITRRHGRYRR